MTPLAHRIVSNLTMPVKERAFADEAGILKDMPDTHCFDLSQVRGVVTELAASFMLGGPDERLAFLPAPLTWLEIPDASGERGGYLMKDAGDDMADVIICTEHGARHMLRLRMGSVSNTGSLLESRHIQRRSDVDIQEAGLHAHIAYAALALINTPRIIGRRQHMPHAGLQRKLARAKGMVGKFPLHAWTEIVLEVTPPEEAGEECREARLSGAKALHFCRSHLRVRRGQLELVKAHWRGDPALGIKQSRYTLKN